MWRWSHIRVQSQIEITVFSTYVEVILTMCVRMDPGGQYSPRMWRWSQELQSIIDIISVFSTYVEVIPRVAVNYRYNFGILHVCGGDPPIIALFEIAFWYSPRMWRWSYLPMHCHHLSSVFSTYVEVILLHNNKLEQKKSILHVCGGDPEDYSNEDKNDSYSPRMWRWS